MADNSGKFPVVLESNKLYLQRYWSYECQLANKIAALTATEHSIEDVDKIIDQYFPVKDEVDWQKEAAIRAVNDTFTIITGGPGTGKTTTVVIYHYYVIG
jgi:exodeoxyribonuclease V alpha subunit